MGLYPVHCLGIYGLSVLIDSEKDQILGKGKYNYVYEVDSLTIFLLQSLPQVPRLFMPAVGCPKCAYPNDENFRFCQRCGYKRREGQCQRPSPLRAPIDSANIMRRKEELRSRRLSTPYMRQKSALEKEFSSFLGKLEPPRDVISATPDDVISFFNMEGQFRKNPSSSRRMSVFGYQNEVRLLLSKTPSLWNC